MSLHLLKLGVARKLPGPLTSVARHAGGCSSLKARSGRSLSALHRRLVCACVSVALAANRAGSSFLGGRDSSAMESYDVIANQPVVIDNVSCVFSISKGTYAVLPEGIASRCRRFFVTGQACQAGSTTAASILPPPIVRRQGGPVGNHGLERFGVNKGKTCQSEPGPWARGSRGLNRSVSFGTHPFPVLGNSIGCFGCRS